MIIEGKVALITGGASGLGRAVAEKLHQSGAHIVVIDLNDNLGESLANELNGLYVKADVTSESEVEQAFVQAEEKFGKKVQILVNCAGVGSPAKVINRDGSGLALNQFAKIININLMGTFNVLAQFAARLHQLETTDEERGVIINTASVAAFDGQIGQPAYSASKAGVVGMTLPIARELARFRIRIMTIAPGIFKTPLLASLPQEAQDSLGKQVPFPSRLGEPSEFAHLVGSIVENPMLNGEVIRLDGSIRMTAK